MDFSLGTESQPRRRPVAVVLSPVRDGQRRGRSQRTRVETKSMSKKTAKKTKQLLKKPRAAHLILYTETCTPRSLRLAYRPAFRTTEEPGFRVQPKPFRMVNLPTEERVISPAEPCVAMNHDMTRITSLIVNHEYRDHQSGTGRLNRSRIELSACQSPLAPEYANHVVYHHGKPNSGRHIPLGWRKAKDRELGCRETPQLLSERQHIP